MDKNAQWSAQRSEQFQMLMSFVLKGLNWKFVLCYIDDILVFSPNLETHLQHLQEVFQRLRQANLTLKPSKCNFGVTKFSSLVMFFLKMVWQWIQETQIRFKISLSQ